MKNGLSQDELARICAILKTVPSVDKAVLFGSRAMGLARTNSDVDIMLYGDKLKIRDIVEINSLLDETTLPYHFDLIRYDAKNLNLIEHVERYGKVIFQRSGQLDVRSNKRLSDICFFADGRVAIADLDLDTYISTENMLPNKEGITRSAGLPTVPQTQAYQAGDVLVSNIRPYFRKIWLADRDGGCSNDVLVLRAKESCNPKFLYYLLSDNNFFDYATSTAKGTKMPRGDKNAIMRYEVSIPTNLNEQIEIGSTLSALDAKIANNTAINHNLEQMAQAIFKSWFVDFEPWGGVMPGDWREIELSAILTARVEKSNDFSIPLFSVTDTGIFPRDEKFNKVLSNPNTKNKLAYETDIVFGMSREILNWGIMRSSIGAVSSAYNVFAVDARVNSKYLESFIKVHASYFKDLIRPATREGQGVDKSALMKKKIYLPSDKILVKYYDVENSLTEMIRSNTAESARLVTIRDTLLPRLMSGEVTI